MGGATTKGMAWPASPVATGCQGNPCSTGIRWGVSPAAQMGCWRNTSGSPCVWGGGLAKGLFERPPKEPQPKGGEGGLEQGLFLAPGAPFNNPAPQAGGGGVLDPTPPRPPSEDWTNFFFWVFVQSTFSFGAFSANSAN